MALVALMKQKTVTQEAAEWASGNPDAPKMNLQGISGSRVGVGPQNDGSDKLCDRNLRLYVRPSDGLTGVSLERHTRRRCGKRLKRQGCSSVITV